jgi:CheY-like chemotaxis protein
LSEHSKTASRGAAASLATIFVVEDDADLGLALWQFLEEEVPCRVVLSPDGFAALKLVRSIIPHLFLLDYNLPGMNGLELVDHLRATPNGEHTPIILMSARIPREGVWERQQCVPPPYRTGLRL